MSNEAMLNQSYAINKDDQSAWNDIHNLSPYDFVEHTVYGTSGYRDASYLIPNPKESFYNTRRLSTGFRGHLKPIVSAMIDPVFDSAIVRECDSDNFSKFIANADNAGTSLQTMIRNAMYPARYNGTTFIVVDNFKIDTIPQTQKAAIDDRKFPYIYQKKVQTVFNHSTDNYGNLVSITFYDQTIKQGNKDIKQYRQFDIVGWSVLQDIKGTAKTIADLTVISSGNHNLGIVPVVPVLNFVNTHSLKEIADPPTYELARIVFDIYNLESEIRYMSQVQCFSVLYIQADGTSQIVLGPSNFLRIPMDAKLAPAYISPDAAHFVNLMNYWQELRRELYRIAKQEGVEGVVQAKSGIAKEWDFRAQESVLKETAQAAKELEIKITDIFKLYTNESFDYNPVYPEQFNPNHDNDMIVRILQIQDRMPPKALANSLWKKVAQIEYKNDEDQLTEINNALDMEAEAVTMARNAIAEGLGAQQDTQGQGTDNTSMDKQGV
jgi:hypothetical protein